MVARVSKPQVSYAAPIARQIVERIEPVEMIYRQIGYLFRRC
jgi:hypothetical protein